MTRSDNVLSMQLTLIDVMKNAWKLSYERLSDLLIEYSILEYIDTCYEYFNSMGDRGIINELEEFIKDQGGVID